MRKKMELERTRSSGETETLKGYQVSKSFFTHKGVSGYWIVCHIPTGWYVLGLERDFLRDVEGACKKAEGLLEWDSISTPEDVEPALTRAGFNEHDNRVIDCLYSL